MDAKTSAELDALRALVDERFTSLSAMLAPVLATHISMKAQQDAEAVVAAQVVAQNPAHGGPSSGSGRRPDTVLFQSLNSGFATLADLLSQIIVMLQAQAPGQPQVPGQST